MTTEDTKAEGRRRVGVGKRTCRNSILRTLFYLPFVIHVAKRPELCAINDNINDSDPNVMPCEWNISLYGVFSSADFDFFPQLPIPHALKSHSHTHIATHTHAYLI